MLLFGGIIQKIYLKKQVLLFKKPSNKIFSEQEDIFSERIQIISEQEDIISEKIKTISALVFGWWDFPLIKFHPIHSKTEEKHA